MISTTDSTIVFDLDDPKMAIDSPWSLDTSLAGSAYQALKSTLIISSR